MGAPWSAFDFSLARGRLRLHRPWACWWRADRPVRTASATGTCGPACSPRVQVVGSLVFEFVFAHGIAVTEGLYLDSLSLLMAFVIGVIGSGICRLRRGLHARTSSVTKTSSPPRARRPPPTARTSSSRSCSPSSPPCSSSCSLTTWPGCSPCWEVTTVCSFFLIGYTKHRGGHQPTRSARSSMNLARRHRLYLVALYCMAHPAVARSSSSTASWTSASSSPSFVVLPLGAARLRRP